MKGVRARMVLIVPFMELKLMILSAYNYPDMVLIVPFMELKLRSKTVSSCSWLS